MQSFLAGISDKRCSEVDLFYTKVQNKFLFITLQRLNLEKMCNISIWVNKNLKIKTFYSNVFIHYLQEKQKRLPSI